ncbi:amidohydrolase family protein [Frankia sp. Cppng1_Ct_nod]|uniref:amidohydrolase family protein n=1 Tax=Frankia sp. Cppng1_Ct_nod TaxID=2897162 RepID=UPI001041510B|nr:amidohydrolase family protein [Frankia sp. Cppng1_Ct_nod]
MSGDIRYGLYDCDNHCYEPRDSFTRFLPSRYLDEAVRPGLSPDGREVPFVGDRPLTFVDGEIYGQVGRPGSLAEMLRSMKSGTVTEGYAWEQPRPEYLDRDARLQTMDAQGVQAILLFPSVAVTAEGFHRTSEQLYRNFHAFNEWFYEEWGFAYRDRIFAAPSIPMRDLDAAVREVEFVLARGARVVAMRPGPVYGRSPADPYFDPVWSRLDEAGVSVAYHVTESGYNRDVSSLWGENPDPSSYSQSSWQWMNCYCDRPIMDTLSALVYGNLFGRFPRLRVVSVEHGAEWFPYFVRRLDKMRGMGRNGPWIGGRLQERPSEIVKRHVKVTPFPEDDVVKIANEAGAESIVLGSDWPHPEGYATPRDFLDHAAALTDEQRRTIAHDNGRSLLDVR